MHILILILILYLKKIELLTKITDPSLEFYTDRNVIKYLNLWKLNECSP